MSVTGFHPILMPTCFEQCCHAGMLTSRKQLVMRSHGCARGSGFDGTFSLSS
jgi:hypothetical protein